MSKEDSNLEENATGGSPISLNPGMTLSGIGDPMLPTPTSVGSGDMLTVADIDDDEEEAKKDKTKRKLEMENLHLTFNKFINEDTVNEWGSSDQGYMNKSIHDDAGKPKKMPSPFDDKLRDAAEDAVDKYWDDWEEYDTDREGLIDNAVRGYLRSYFKKDFDLLTKMFEEEELLEAINPSKIEKSLNKQLGFQFFGEEDESIKLLKEPIRIESSYYGRSLKKAASNFKMSVVYVYGAFTNEYNEDLAVAGIISRTKDTTKVIMLTSEDWKAIYNGEAVVEYTGTDILSACQSKSKEIVNHLAKFPRDGSVYESIISEGKFEDGIADHQEIINDPKRTVYHLVDEIQFSTGDMTEKQWEMFMYGRYAKYRNDTDKKIKEKMYKVLTKWLAESIVTGFTEAKMTKDKLENLIYSLENQKDSWHPSSDSKKKAMLDKLKKDLSKFESIVAEKREDVGKYNTVKKVIAKLGRRPSEQDLATFINNNYYDVTEVERGDDDPSANDKIADLVGFYKFDIDDWDIAWVDAQNESIVTEEVVYNSSNTKPEAAKKATKEFGKLLPKANKDVKPYEFAVVKTKAKNYRLAIKSGSYVAHEFMTNLKDDGILTADIVKDAVANVIKLNPDEFNESVVNEEKIKYIKGKTYQSSGHWTVVVDSNSSGLDIRVNHSAGWRLSPHDEREETFELLDNGRKRATLNFKSGNIDKFGQEMFDLNDRTTNGNQTKLTAKDYADIIRVWIDMKMANESVNEAKNTIGLAFKEEQDYLDFKEFVAEQPRGAIRKNIGFDSKTKSWNVEMDVKVLDSIYGEGTPSNKESGWYGGLPDDFESVIIEGAISKSRFETFLNEASRRKVHKAAKQGSYPAVIVVVQDGKVIHQEPVSTPDIAPATFNVMQEKYPKALLHLEDKTGKRLFSESIVNEARQAPAKTLFKMIVKGSASEIEGVKISSAMAQAALDWFDRSTYARKYEKQVKTAGMGAVAPLIFGDNWGIKKTIPSKLKAEFKELQAEYKRVMPENESVVTESLSIAGMASMLLGLGIAARIGFMSDEKYASMIGSIIPTAKAIVKSLPIIGDKVKNQELKDYQTKEVEKYLNGEISDKDIVAILNENPKLKKAIEDVATSGLNYKEYYKLIKEIGGAADKWGNTHRKFKQLRKKISDGKVLESLVTEGMSKSAIKKAIKTIDKQIDTETGGDGEPLDNETLQALEQERERLLAMNEGKIKNSKEIKELEELLKSIKSNTPAAQGRKASIQDDIERLKNESLVNEAKAYKLKASEFGGDTHSAAYNVKGETTWRVHSTYAIDQVSGENNPEERDVIFFEAMPINNDIYIKIGGINNLKRSNGSTVGENFGTTIEEWKKDPKGIAKEASEFLTDAAHLKWINKKARSEGQVIKWALKDDYASVIEDLVNKSLGLNEAKTSKEKLEYLLWDLENSNKLSNPSDPKKKAALIKKLKKQLDTVKESLVVESSEEAYSLHRLGDNLGQEVAAEFLSKHDVDLKLLTKAVQQKTINKYEIRDVVNGSAHKLKVKTFIKDFVNESSITEAKLTRGLKPLLTIGSTINKKAGEDALLDLSDKFDRIDDEYAGTIASWLDMAIELMQDGYSGDATKKLKQFNKACKDVLNGKEVGSAFESTVNEAKGVNRAELTDYLEKHLKLVRTSEEFDGTEGGIWTSAENGEKFSGSQIFDYYSESSKYEFGVLNKFAKVLSKMGWYCEFYDPGTVMIWEE